MLLNHYTAFLEKHMQGKPGSLLNEEGGTATFTNLVYQKAESMLPMLMHQTGDIIVGSDNTAETGSSYGLKKKITSGLNLALVKSMVDNDDGSHSSVMTATYTNISSDTITIGEVGLKGNVKLTGSSTTTSIIIDRTPLGTPLTIQPGEVGRIVYTITMA